jgi:hypothetical protein
VALTAFAVSLPMPRIVLAQEESARRIIKADAILPVVVMCEILL